MKKKLNKKFEETKRYKKLEKAFGVYSKYMSKIFDEVDMEALKKIYEKETKE